MSVSTTKPSPRARLVRWLLAASCAGALVLLWQPAWIQFCVWRGKACLRDGGNAAAVRWLRGAARFAPEDGALDYLLARAYRRLDDFKPAEDCLRQAQRKHWKFGDVQREYWLIAAQSQQFKLMQAHWPELLSDPRDDGREIRNAFVAWCMARWRTQDALAVLATWQRDYPADARPHYWRGLIWEDANQWTDAVQELERAVELAPDRADARLHLAEDLLKLRRYEEAEKHFRHLLTSSRPSQKPILGRAKCLAKLGNATESIAILGAELRQRPDDLDVLQTLGEIELFAGKPAAAAQHLEPVARRRPASRPVRYALAQALQAVGKADAAKPHFAFVAEAEKAAPRLHALWQEVSKQPDNLALRFEYAMLVWQFRSREEGARELEILLMDAPDYVQAHAALDEHYRWLGDKRRAEQHRRQADNAEAGRAS